MGFRLAGWLLVAFAAALLVVTLSVASVRRASPRAQFLLVLGLLLGSLDTALGNSPAWLSYALTGASVTLVAIAVPETWRRSRNHLREVGLLRPAAAKRRGA